LSFLNAQHLLQLAWRHFGGRDKGGIFSIATLKNAGAEALRSEGAKKEEAAKGIVDGLAIAAATFHRHTTIAGAARAQYLSEDPDKTGGQVRGRVVDPVLKGGTKAAVKEIVHVNLDAGPFVLQLAVDVVDVATADERPGLFGLVVVVMIYGDHREKKRPHAQHTLYRNFQCTRVTAGKQQAMPES
jgi:hypothetical protein